MYWTVRDADGNVLLVTTDKGNAEACLDAHPGSTLSGVPEDATA